MAVNFVPKDGQQIEEYGGYLLVYSTSPPSVSIFEEISHGKFKRRRDILGPSAHKHDQWGNKLYFSIKSADEGLLKAKNYIDNHIVKWADKNKKD